MQHFGRLKTLQIGGMAAATLSLLLVLLTMQSANPAQILAGILLIALIVLLIILFLMTKKAEDAILETNHWYEQILDLWESPLSITDLNMNWTFINKTVEGLLNKKRSEVIGQHCSSWGANICNTDNCGVTCLRKGLQRTFFNQWQTDFRVNTHYLYDRKGAKVGHVEIVTNIDSQKQLSRLLRNARQTASNVASGSRELFNSAQTLSTGATEQAATTEQISSSMNEVESQTKMNSENANQAKIVSQKTRETVQQGNQQMALMVESMKTINKTSSEVSKVIKVIDEIAFQTNLLALNAAVEAARAGKYGKGFAVVAEEVRALAGRSAEAAKDTTELIEKSIKGVETGVRNADETASILAEVNNSVEKMNDLVSEIASNSIEQTTSIEEVNRGLAQVNTVVQENASISEENASASEEVKAQVEQLLKLTEGITITEDIGEDDTVEIESMPPAPPAPPAPKPKPKPAPRIEQKPESQTGTRRMITLDDDDYGKY